MATEEQLAATLKERNALKSQIKNDKMIIADQKNSFYKLYDYTETIEKGSSKYPVTFVGNL